MRFNGAAGGCALVIAIIAGAAVAAFLLPFAAGALAVFGVGMMFYQIVMLIIKKRAETKKRNAARASVQHIKRVRSMNAIPSPDGADIEFANNPPHWDKDQKWWFDGSRWINAYPSPE